MFEGRAFKNEFANELNACYEDETNGVYATCLRFKQYVQTLKDKIEADNRRILAEIKGEDEDVARSMLNQVDNINHLDFFTDMLFQSAIVAIYSYFDIKLAELAGICEKHNEGNKIKKVADFGGKKISPIIKNKNFLLSEIIPELVQAAQIFDKILLWRDLRNFIVHGSISKKTKKKLIFAYSIKITTNHVAFENINPIVDFLELTKNYLSCIVDYTNEKYDLVEYHTFESKKRSE